MPSFVLIGDGHPASATLKHLLGSGASVRAVFATAGRENRGALTRLCGDAGIPLIDSDVLERPEGVDAVASAFDWILNINSTVLLPSSFLALGSAGALNMHPGLLPEYAGLHTHQWAIRNGETVFGVTVHEMVPSVDAGGIVLRRTFDITGSDTGLSLYLKCMEEGIAAFCEVLDTILSGATLSVTPQDLGQRRLYRHRDATDGVLDWSLDAIALERFVRAGSYAPLTSPSYTPTVQLPDGSEAVVWKLGVCRRPSPEGAVPGQVLAGEGDMGPQVVSGGGTSVVISAITHQGVQLEGQGTQTVLVPGLRLP